MVDDVFGDGGPKQRHPVRQPLGDASPMQGKIGCTRTLHLSIVIGAGSTRIHVLPLAIPL